MKESKKMRDEFIGDLYSFLDGDDCDENMEEFDDKLKEIVSQVEMETRIEKNIQCEKDELKKVTVWSFIDAAIDGAFNIWYLTEVDTMIEIENQNNYNQNNDNEEKEVYLSDEFVDSVQTFIGSDIHQEAIENSENLDRTFEDKVRSVIIRTANGDKKYQG